MEAALVNLKSRGKLIHPNLNFYYFIHRIEEKFQKFSNSAFVYDLILEEILHEEKLIFPCQIHATDVMSFVVVYYLRMRLRQFSQQENLKNKKINRHKKKLPKCILHKLIKIKRF